jgi:hypothetical protein
MADVQCATCDESIPAEVATRCHDCRKLHCDNELTEDEGDWQILRCQACVDLIPSGSLCDPSDEDRDNRGDL